MNARQMALGGVTVALAVVIMCMGGLVPMATYILPMLCCILLQLIGKPLGKQGSWVWYSAVSILSILFSSDKEAAAIYLFLGYYPIMKPLIDRKKVRVLLKLMLFNVSTLTMYMLLIHLFGMSAIAAEFQEIGAFLTVVTLALGNACFIILDKILYLISCRA